MWVIKAENHKMLVRIANRDDTNQAANLEASGSALFAYAFLADS